MVVRASLNPYSNGMWIELTTSRRFTRLPSLNPYSNGMWIERVHRQPVVQLQVLILILMECG